MIQLRLYQEAVQVKYAGAEPVGSKEEVPKAFAEVEGTYYWKVEV